MLKVTPPNEIFFQKQGETLVGEFSLTNNYVGCFIAFKVFSQCTQIKSTEPTLFEVEPHSGLLQPDHSQTVRIVSESSLGGDSPKGFAQNYKFVIEYVVLEKQPRSVDQAMEKIKGPSMQSHRLYVNTFAEADIELKVYDSSPLNDYAKEKNDEARMDIAPLFQQNRKSRLSKNGTKTVDSQQRIEHLKSRIDELERQKSGLIHSNRPARGSFVTIKKLLLFIIMVLVGNLLAKQCGISQLMKPPPPKDYSIFSLDRFWESDTSEWRPWS